MAVDALKSLFFGSVLPNALLLLGAGFLLANLRLLARFIQFWRLKSTAQLTWPRRRQRSYGISLGFGLIFGLLVLVKVAFQGRPLADAFGEGMMFVYYAYAFPLSLRIGHGFYDGGVWSNTGFMSYDQIGGLSWQEGGELTLVLIHRTRKRTRRLELPQEHYGEARRLLRDKIAGRDIDFTGRVFDLGGDEREVV
ncbi:MAG: hypothetical protein CL473_00365 [Acidobacteria bacterium]|nr:hypothetical protein [Acidobacteriota bacterium]